MPRLQAARRARSLTQALPSRTRIYLPLLAAAAVVVAIDQLTKSWALGALDEPIELVGETVQLRLAFNSGGAFGLLPGVPGFFLLAALVVVAVILLTVRHVDRVSWAVPLGMILGGGLGNAADRVARDLDGQVVDFIDIGWWPVFNFADIAIVVGGAILLIVSWRDEHADT